jgi:hypothetical protein
MSELLHVLSATSRALLVRTTLNPNTVLTGRELLAATVAVESKPHNIAAHNMKPMPSAFIYAECRERAVGSQVRAQPSSSRLGVGG